MKPHFIQVTDTEDSTVFWINFSRVEGMFRNEENTATKLIFQGGSAFVTETPLSIISQLQGVTH